MPRYYFRTNDGDRLVSPDDAVELSGPEAARQAAHSSLLDMARDTIPDGDQRTISAQVLDERGSLVYNATLTLSGEWAVADRSAFSKVGVEVR